MQRLGDLADRGNVDLPPVEFEALYAPRYSEKYT
jgi:hypothetical protein